MFLEQNVLIGLFIQIVVSEDWINQAWTSYHMRKIAERACAGNAGNLFSATDFKGKPLVNDPGMRHGTCVTHVPWFMLGSLARGGGKNVPGIPGSCTTHNFTYLARDPLRCRYAPENWAIIVIGSTDGLSMVRRQSFTWADDDLSIGFQGSYFSKRLMETPISLTYYFNAFEYVPC